MPSYDFAVVDGKRVPICPDCGAIGFTCRSPSGPGLQIIREEDMAAGEFVALTEPVYLDESRTRVVPAESAEARWFLGAPGYQIPKQQAEELGIMDSTEAPRPIGEILAEREAAHRRTMEQSTNTIVVPAASHELLETDRRTIDKTSGKALGMSGPVEQSPTSLVGKAKAANDDDEDADDDVKPASGTRAAAPSQTGERAAPENKSKAPAENK